MGLAYPAVDLDVLQIRPDAALIDEDIVGAVQRYAGDFKLIHAHVPYGHAPVVIPVNAMVSAGSQVTVFYQQIGRGDQLLAKVGRALFGSKRLVVQLNQREEPLVQAMAFGLGQGMAV